MIENIKNNNMLREGAYKKRVEKEEETETMKKECCYYELTDGGYLVSETLFERNYEEEEKYGYKPCWKQKTVKSYATMEAPDQLSKDDNMKRLIETLNKTTGSTY